MGTAANPCKTAQPLEPFAFGTQPLKQLVSALHTAVHSLAVYVRTAWTRQGTMRPALRLDQPLACLTSPVPAGDIAAAVAARLVLGARPCKQSTAAAVITIAAVASRRLRWAPEARRWPLCCCCCCCRCCLLPTQWGMRPVSGRRTARAGTHYPARRCFSSHCCAAAWRVHGRVCVCVRLLLLRVCACVRRACVCCVRASSSYARGGGLSKGRHESGGDRARTHVAWSQMAIIGLAATSVVATCNN